MRLQFQKKQKATQLSKNNKKTLQKKRTTTNLPNPRDPGSPSENGNGA